MGKKQKPAKAPDALPDQRRFFGKTDDGDWVETKIQELVPNQVIAVVDESEWSPKEVDLYVVDSVPYVGKAGLWTVQVNDYKPGDVKD